MVRQAKNWWVRMAAALGVAFSMMGIVIAYPPRVVARPVEISDDALLTAETGFSPAEIQQIFEKSASPLAAYRETLGEQSLSAAELFWAAAQHADYGVSPKALLTTLYLEDGWNWAQSGGLYDHLKQIALELQRGYLAGQASAESGGAKGIGPAQSTAATYTLTRYYSASAKSVGPAAGTLQDWSRAYRQLFGSDPAQPVSPKAAATRVPFMRLPFDNPAGGFYPIEAFFDHAYPGKIEEPSLLRADGKALPGAHYSACQRAVTCYSGHNATDFTMPTGTPLYAVAAGKVVERVDSEGGLLIDHGNGYRTIYWHMDKVVVGWGQAVKDGQLIGWSDSRGTSSHPHLHFGLRLTALSQDVDPFGWWSTNRDPVPGPSRFMWQGDLTADNGEPQTWLFYNQYWTRDDRGFGGSSWYTRTARPANSTNWGMWGTYLSTAGNYTVSAYWPKTNENTTAAVYQVWHDGGMTPVRVNQRADGDRFVPLGTFRFETGPVVVILTDAAPDAPPEQRLYFDAIRWQPDQVKQYLPVVSAGQ